jgi:hypothetical protein
LERRIAINELCRSQPGCFGQVGATRDTIIGEETQSDHPPRTPCTSVDWQHQPNRPGEVRRTPDPGVSLPQGLSYKMELAIFEVAEPTMQQLGGGPTGRLHDPAPFVQRDAVATFR